MSAEDKLGKSLDSIIEENRSSFKGKSRGDRPRPGAGGGGSGSKPKGMRIDGPRSKNLRVQGLNRPQGQGQRSAPRGGAGTDAGLGVRSAGIKKRSARAAPVYTYDEDMDTGDYGAPAPRRQQFQRGGGFGGGRGGRGGYGGEDRFEDVGAGYKRREVPKGNSDGFWSHDLYDEREQGPPRRARVMPSQQNAQPNGFTLTVSNLDYTVSDKDITELFETCGPLLDAFVHFDNSGRSNGVATIVYKSKVHADKAIAEYDGVKLDGKELAIQYAVEEDQHIKHLSSGKTISRPADGPAPNSFKRAISALPVRGMGGDAVRSAGPRTGGGGGGMGRMGGGMGDRMGGGGGRGRPAPRGGAMGNRLRSTVTRTKADLDAEMDSMQE